MPTFLSGHQKIFWDLLYTTGLWGSSGRITPSEHTITVVSPWLTDVSATASGWPEELSMHACSTRDPPDSLCVTLLSLMKMGFKVRVVVMDREGKWMNKEKKSLLKNEEELMNKLRNHGATCHRRKDMHFKWLCTPFGLWKGSSNSTANGLFGRLEEQNDVYYSVSNTGTYQHQKEQMDLATSLSSDYFDGTMDISEYGIGLNYSIYESNLPESTAPQTSQPVTPGPLDIGECPPFVPSNYHPVGQIPSDEDGTLSEDQRISIAVWINQTVERLLSFIDFVFSNGLHASDFPQEAPWIESVSVKTLGNNVITLADSPQEIVQDDLEFQTTHEILFRIKDKFHVLQCCGITVGEDGGFCLSDGKDACGINLKPVYSEVLMEYSPVEEGANEERIDRLFRLVHTLIHFTCFVVHSEAIPGYIASELSACILEIEPDFLSLIEDHY